MHLPGARQWLARSPNASRGQRLTDAVYVAVVAQIGEAGLRDATMTSISKRAGTGKSSLYRRWPNVRALVLESLIHALEETIRATDRATGPSATAWSRAWLPYPRS